MTSPVAGAGQPAGWPSRLEDRGTDFPFYNGVPVPLARASWLFVMAAVAAAILVLMAPLAWPGGWVGAFAPAVLLAAIPLAALAIVAPGHWSVLFGRVRGREVRLMIGFALLNVVVSMSIGALVHTLAVVEANKSASILAELDLAGRLAFFARTAPQLLGEEVITVLPFLALLTWLHRTVGVGRSGAVVGAWLITAVLFGLIHLPTYNWNLLQCIVVIGSARLVLTLPWIMTKNLWVSTGAHIINDWLLFAMMIAGAGLSGPR